MNNNDVPIWEKYTLTIEEAAKYFRIGESKLRKLAEENPVPDWVMMNGNRIQIKRKQFEKMIEEILRRDYHTVRDRASHFGTLRTDGS